MKSAEIIPSGGSLLQALTGLQPALPILHLYAEPDEAGFLAAQQALATEPWFQVQKLGAQSDFPMFEASGDIVRAIEGSWWRSSEMMHRTRFGCPARDVCCRLEHYSSV